MRQSSAWRVTRRGEEAESEARQCLRDVLREGVRRMLHVTIEDEVAVYLEEHQAERA